MARYEVSEDRGQPQRLEMLRCEREECSRIWRRSQRPGPTPRFCSDSCKQANYRALRTLSGAAREAFLQRQQLRRQSWEAMAPAVEPDDAAVPQEAPVVAGRVVRELERLARDIGAARARGALGSQVEAFYRRFATLKEHAGEHTALLSDSVADLQAGLRLVQLQLAALLSGDSSPGS